METEVPPGLTKTVKPASHNAFHSQSTCLDIGDDDSPEESTPKPTKKYAPIFKRALKKIKSKKSSTSKETKVIQLVEDFNDDDDDDVEDLGGDLSASNSFCESSRSFSSARGLEASQRSMSQVGDVPPPWPSVQGWCTVAAKLPSPTGDRKETCEDTKEDNPKSKKKKGKKKTEDEFGSDSESSGKKRKSKKKQKKKSKDEKIAEDAEQKEKLQDDINQLMSCYGPGWTPQEQQFTHPTEHKGRKSKKIMNMDSVGWNSFENEESNDSEPSIAANAKMNKTGYGMNKPASDLNPHGVVNPSYRTVNSSIKDDSLAEDTLDTLSNSSGSCDFQLHRSQSENILDRDRGYSRSESHSSSHRKSSIASSDSLPKSWATSSQDGKPSSNSDDGFVKEKKGILKRMFSRKKPPKPQPKPDMQKAVGTVLAAKKWKQKLGLKSKQKDSRPRSNSIVSASASLCLSESESSNQGAPAKPEKRRLIHLRRSSKYRDKHLVQPLTGERNSRKSSHTSQSADVRSVSPPSSRRSSNSSSNNAGPGENSSPPPMRRQSWFDTSTPLQKKKKGDSSSSKDSSFSDDRLVNQKSSSKGMFKAARMLLAASKWKKKTKVKEFVEESDNMKNELVEEVKIQSTEELDVKEGKIEVVDGVFSVNQEPEVDEPWKDEDEGTVQDTLENFSDDDWMKSSDEEDSSLSKSRPKIIMSQATETTVFHDTTAKKTETQKKSKKTTASLGSATDDFFTPSNTSSRSSTSPRQSLADTEDQPVFKSQATLKLQKPNTSSMYAGSVFDSDDEDSKNEDHRDTVVKEASHSSLKDSRSKNLGIENTNEIIRIRRNSAVQRAFSRASEALAQMPLATDIPSDEDELKKSATEIGSKARCAKCVSGKGDLSGQWEGTDSLDDDTNNDPLCLSCNG